MTTKREQIQRLIAGAGEAGIFSTDIARILGLTVHHASNFIHAIRRDGACFTAMNNSNGRACAFARKEWADAYAAQPAPTHQTCKKCGFSKPMDAFFPCKGMRSGRESVCRVCRTHKPDAAPKPPTLSRRIADLAEKSAGRPITSEDVAAALGMTRNVASARLSDAVKLGHVHGITVDGIRFVFATAAAAKACPLEHLERRAKELTSAYRVEGARKRTSNCAKQETILKANTKDAPVKLRRDAMQPKGEAVITAATKITRIPSFDHGARFRPEPGFVGAFSRVDVGRDVQTGKGWGA